MGWFSQLLSGKDSNSSDGEEEKEIVEEKIIDSEVTAEQHFERAYAEVVLTDGTAENVVYDKRNNGGEMIVLTHFDEDAFKPSFSWSNDFILNKRPLERHKVLYSPSNIQCIEPYASKEMVAYATIPHTVTKVRYNNEPDNHWHREGETYDTDEISDVTIQPLSEYEEGE